MRACLFAAIAVFAPSVALAAMTCTFPTECMVGEACSDSGYSISVETDLAPGSLAMEGGFPTDDTIVTDAETIAVSWNSAGAALIATGTTGSASHMLSLAPEGAALYSVHLPAAELAIVYTGTCEGP